MDICKERGEIGKKGMIKKIGPKIGISVWETAGDLKKKEKTV